ncbi:ATP-binding cassette domain-containing protein [bacterium]|nr:ATP-binding cassette domain-containing protein [bacterium]MBU1983040.1 ATP-binding cassette domain-containing protein [bacterium]
MADSQRIILELANVASGYGNRAVLTGVGISVGKGELIVIEGATGAGKTTLIRLLLGVQPARSGYVRVLGSDVARVSSATLTQLRRQMGVVFQIPQFLAQESVMTNVALPLLIAGISSSKSRALATRALMDAGLTGSARKRPGQLSGGEQARLQIARALIHHPQLILADEPFAHLDPESVAAAESLLATAHARGSAVLITTHSPTRLADRAVRYRMEGGKLACQS